MSPTQVGLRKASNAGCFSLHSTQVALTAGSFAALVALPYILIQKLTAARILKIHQPCLKNRQKRTGLKNRSFRYYGGTGYRLWYRLIILPFYISEMDFQKYIFFSVI
jgi:hypothetical protein